MLAGTGSSAVAEHLRSCEACRSVARRLLAAHELMRAAYLGAVPRQSAEEVARQAVVLAGAEAEREVARRRILRAGGWGLIPLAAAAAVVLTVVARRDVHQPLVSPNPLPMAP